MKTLIPTFLLLCIGSGLAFPVDNDNDNVPATTRQGTVLPRSFDHSASPIVARSLFEELVQAVNPSGDEYTDGDQDTDHTGDNELQKRKGGGGGRGGGGGGGRSGGLSGGRSGGGGKVSGSPGRGTRPVVSSGSSAKFFSGGGLAVYRSGSSGGRGVSRPFVGPIGIWPGFWFYPSLYYYPYDYDYRWTFHNKTTGRDETKEVMCVCSFYTDCTCSGTKDKEFIKRMINDGRYKDLDPKLVTVARLDKEYIFLNGTVENGTTPATGGASGTSVPSVYVLTTSALAALMVSFLSL